MHHEYRSFLFDKFLYETLVTILTKSYMKHLFTQLHSDFRSYFTMEISHDYPLIKYRRKHVAIHYFTRFLRLTNET